MIFDTAAKLNVFLDPFTSYESNKLDILMKQFVPSLKLDRTLPTRLNSLPSETEVLYWLHFACYVASYECGKKVIETYSNFGLKLILSQKTRYQTALEICQDLVDYGQQLIDYEDIDCLKLNDTTIWERCLDDGNNTSLFQQWCKSCSELSGCILYVYGFKKHYKKSYCHFATFFKTRYLLDVEISKNLKEIEIPKGRATQIRVKKSHTSLCRILRSCKFLKSLN